MKTITINGEPATITKRHGNVVTVELRERPMVKRPLGVFYEKRILRFPAHAAATHGFEKFRDESEKSLTY